MKLKNAIIIFVVIMFLVSPIDILGEKASKHATLNHVQRKLEENDNYIVVKYGEETTYDANNKFLNNYRSEVDHVIYEDQPVNLEQQFIIEANGTIQIYFSKRITTLESFFSSKADSNVEKIVSIDFHIDSSLVNDTQYLFYQCSLLEEVNFNNFNTSKVTSMFSLFSDCYKLKSLDLSNFDTSEVTNMGSMFYKCRSLKYLDMSNFNTPKITDNQYSNAFDEVNSLEYINLYNSQINSQIQSLINAKIRDSTRVCIKGDITGITFIKECCDYNIETSGCDPDNFIKIKFKKEVNYPYGFSIIEYDQSENQYRPDIYLINNQNKRYQPNEALTVKKNAEIKIVYNSTISSLEKFFYDYYDSNVEFIESIDLTHFNATLVESLEKTFYGCISVESIDLSTFTAPSLTSMAQTFFHCSSLKSLNLSNINSTLIKNTNRMLCGCESLVYINMTNLVLSNVDDAAYMFYNLKEIKYLDIKGLQLNDKIKAELEGEYGLNDIDNLIVCKNNDENLAIKHESICCVFDIECKQCGNYIIAKYKTRTEYSNGFMNNNRHHIAFIKNGNSKVGPTEPFTIEANTNIEIYFSEPILSLAVFFGSAEDKNVGNIISFDFSYFDSSLLKLTDYLFDKCSSLEEVNFNNFNTSNVLSFMGMFQECTNLKSLFLSNFDTSNALQMNYMFYGCTSLEYLDISNFNTSKVNVRGPTEDFTFKGGNTLKYINIYNAIINNYKSIIQEKVNSESIVCQQEEIITGAKNDCSIFYYSTTNDKHDNYILVKYGSSVTYNANNVFKNENRENVDYLMIGGKRVEPNEDFTIEENDIIEIHFNKIITNLSNFFDHEKDTNTEKIISVDFSYFDSSLLNSIKFLFFDCSSLEEINFNNFNTSKVESMESMFNGCSKLKSLDLSKFEASQVSTMAEMFKGCSELKFLDLSNFDTSEVTNPANMFDSVNSLQYINLYNAQIDKIQSRIEDAIKESTIVCMKDDIKIKLILKPVVI